ncbi:DUF4190 domain-containing protein [Arthrobacter oryzae]|uniref:DUF4190 domain-containing protein n=1 Tax=Arthrobacter oryzae TaxID=409290 RepID=UPI0028617587|nr:DUF4190 domain-containing protein [Arthrobacter oryzae]MDR6508067.1 hypothetical protein [Arthrobacter oryzae]
MIITAAWILWRRLDGLTWLAMIPTALVAVVTFAAALDMPWYGFFYSGSSGGGIDPETGLFTSGGPSVPDLIMDSVGRLVLVTVMAAACIVAAEGIHSLSGRWARSRPAPLPQREAAHGTGEVLKQVRTTEDGKPLYVTVENPDIKQGPRRTSGTNTLAILALVFGLICGLAAIPLGHIALVHIRRTGESGRGMAIAGLVLGYAWAGLIALYIIIVATAASRL